MQNGEVIDPDNDQTLLWMNIISIPSGYTYLGATPLSVSTRPTEAGKIFYRTGIQDARGNLVNLRVYLEKESDIGINATKVAVHGIPGLRLYPNPVGETLYAEAAEEITALAVYDMSGVLVRRSEGDRIALHGLAPGIYLVQITAGNKTAYRKIIVL